MSKRGKAGAAHTAGCENGVYEQRRAEAASTGDHVLEKGVFVEERKEEIFLHKVGLEKSTEQLIVRRDGCPLRRIGGIDVGINHLRSVQGRLVQSMIVSYAGREVRRRRPVPLGIEVLAVSQRRRVWVTGRPEEAGDAEHSAQAVLIASLWADGQLEEHISRADVAHDVLDSYTGADAVQNLEHFGLGADAKQLMELFVRAALLLLRVEPASQRLAVCLSRVRIVDTLGVA